MKTIFERTEEMLEVLDEAILKGLKGSVSMSAEETQILVDIRGQLIDQKGL